MECSMKDLTNPESKRQSGLIEILGKPKILNVLKADLAKALKNAEIDGMITAFGLEIKDGKVIVNKDKLRYGKIVITADADVDGSHIRALFLTFIWKFAYERSWRDGPVRNG